MTFESRGFAVAQPLLVEATSSREGRGLRIGPHGGNM